MSYENYDRWKKEPIKEQPRLSVIIPAYNEEIRIIPTIGAMAAHISSLGFPWELILADDGSKDQTVQMVKELNLANVQVLETPKNGGKGSAVQRGMLAARGEYLLFADADNSTPIEELSKLLTCLSDGGYDIAVGSRAADGAEESQKSLLRKILSGGLRWLVGNVFRIGVKDTQCGFKMYTQEAAKRLHTAQTIKGFSFDLEILYLADKLGYKVAEVPVRWIDAPGSKVDTSKETQRFLRDLMRIKINDIRGAYVNA